MECGSGAVVRRRERKIHWFLFPQNTDSNRQENRTALRRCLQAVGDKKRQALQLSEGRGVGPLLSSFHRFPTGLSREMGLRKAAQFSPQLLSQFPEVFSIAGNCSPKSALLPSSWLTLRCINSARQHTLLTLLSWGQKLWGVKQVGPPAQASGRASLRCFATQKGQFKRWDYFPHSTLLKAVTNHFPDVDCFTHLSLFLFSLLI